MSSHLSPVEVLVSEIVTGFGVFIKNSLIEAMGNLFYTFLRQYKDSWKSGSDENDLVPVGQISLYSCVIITVHKEAILYCTGIWSRKDIERKCMQSHHPICPPNLSASPFYLTVERTMHATPSVLFRAWTEQIDQWFAAPGTVLMKAEVNAPFFWETHFQGMRSPHYGRFLRLEPDHLVELTWLTGPNGTKGAETVVTIEFVSAGAETQLHLTHAGFVDQESRDQHEQAWPFVLAQLDEKMSSSL